MKHIKGITSFILACSTTLTFCACIRNDRIDSDEIDTKGNSEEITETSEDVIKWSESDHFYLYGHEIVFAQTTVQELYDITDCCIFWDWDETGTYRIYYTIDDMVDIPSCRVFPSEKAKEAQIRSVYIYIQRPNGYPRGNWPLKEGIIYGVSFETNTASLWGDNISFDIPFTMTPEQLIENSGEPYHMEYDKYFYKDCGGNYYDHMFEFDKNERLVSFTLNKITWH